MFKYLIIASILTVGMISCARETNLALQEEDTREVAALTVTIMDDQSTKAIDDSNATAEEAKLDSATVFVFNSQNAYQADTTVAIGAANENGANNYKVSFNVPTGSGKRVYVAMNFSRAMRDSIRLKGLTSMTYSIDDQEGLFYKSSLPAANPATFKGNPMFSTAPVIVDIVKGVTNEANVSVERLTSKITVVKEGPLASTGAIKAANAIFDQKSLEFAVGNKNTKIFPMREQTNSIDPNWDGNLDDYKNDFKNEFDIAGQDYTKWDISKFVQVNDDKNVKVDKRNTKYAFENTHKAPRQGEMTYVVIKAKFTPEAIATSFDGTTKRPVTTTSIGNIKMDSLHVVVDNNSYYYYTDTVEAKKHVEYLNAAHNISSAEYVSYYKQMCFFQVWLNSDPAGKEYQVKRNEYYDISLFNIVRLGDSYPELKPGTGGGVVGEESSITVKITIQRWTTVPMSGVILGS